MNENIIISSWIFSFFFYFIIGWILVLTLRKYTPLEDRLFILSMCTLQWGIINIFIGIVADKNSPLTVISGIVFGIGMISTLIFSTCGKNVVIRLRKMSNNKETKDKSQIQ